MINVQLDGHPDATLPTKSARKIVTYWACRFGSVSCLSQANAELKILMRSNGKKKILSEVYCAGLRASTKTEYEFFWKRLSKSSDEPSRNVLLNALACTANEIWLNEYLSSSLNSTNLKGFAYRSDEQSHIFKAVYQSGPIGFKHALAYLTAHIEEAHMSYRSLSDIVTGMAEHVVSDELANSVRCLITFFSIFIALIFSL